MQFALLEVHLKGWMEESEMPSSAERLLQVEERGENKG